MAKPLPLTLDAKQNFRSVMGRFVTGVTIVTSASEAGPVGMTVNSLTSVSLDPCMLLVCLKKNSITGDAIRSTRNFGVNVLSQPQEELALRFAKPIEDRFRGVDFALTENSGVPLILGSIAHVVCDLAMVHEAGDHEIFLGQVTHASFKTELEPLVFCHTGFGSYMPKPLAVPA